MVVAEITRVELINLYAGINKYIAKVGKKGDRLASIANLVMVHEANEETCNSQNKAFAKIRKEADRKAKKAMIANAKVFDEGDKKGTFVLDEKGEFTFTREGKVKLDEQLDIISDWYEEAEETLRKEKVKIYIEKVKANELPANLDIEFRNALELLIEAE